MKKWMLLLAAVLLFLCLAGCGSKTDDASLKELASQALKDMVAGDFNKVEARMSEACRAQLSAAVLQQAYNSVTMSLGAFVAESDSTVLREGKEATVTLTSRYTSKELVTTFAFNSHAQLDGIWLTYGKTLEQPLENTTQYEEIKLEIGHGAQLLNGKLTLPRNTPKPPVVVLVPGSGVCDLDETLGKAGNKPFRDLAHGLAAQGIATIRFDKRYFTYPEEAQKNPNYTVEDEILQDASCAVELAETDERVDNNRIYVLGHSQGGMLAPKIAADNPSVKGIISMAGSLRGLEDLLLDQQTAAICNSKAFSESEKAAQLQSLNAEVEKIKRLTGSETNQTILGLPASYWGSLNHAAGHRYVQSLAVPMLILQGMSDAQVSVEKDFQSWRDALQNKPNVTYWAYGGLNHLFMPANEANFADYNAPAHVLQKVVDDIALWVNTH